MVNGTISNLKFDLMKEQFKKIFGESLPGKEKCTVKTEDNFHTQHNSRKKLERESCESN